MPRKKTKKTRARVNQKRRTVSRQKVIVSYIAKTGRYSQEDVDVIAPEIEKLVAKHGRGLTAEEVLEAAGKSSSPLHQYFEWNDKTAANRYRTSQAKRIITSFRVRIQTSGGTYEVNGMMSVTNEGELDRPHGRCFTTPRVVLTEQKFTNQVLEEALHRLQEFKRSYGQISEAVTELGPVFKAIDAALKKHGKAA